MIDFTTVPKEFLEIAKKTLSKDSLVLPTIAELNLINFKEENALFALKINLKSFKSWYNQYSFVLLNKELFLKINDILTMFNIKNCVEIGAGTGLFSLWLSKLTNTHIIAVDSYQRKYFENDKIFFDITHCDAIEYLKTYDYIVPTLFIMNWPNYANSFAYNVLKQLPKDSIILYIGEEMGGCTGDDDFFEYSDSHFRSEELDDCFCSFNGIHDKPFLMKKIKD